MSHVNTMKRMVQGFCSVLFLVSFGFAAEDRANDIDPAREALRRATADAVSCGQRAAAARDMALNALENAFAVWHDAEIEWMDALKDGDKENISSADRLLKKAVKDAMKAGRTAEAVVEYATQARSAADKAKYAERRATDPDSDYDLEKAVKEAEKMARVADKAARKAEAIAATLKEKWLIPAMPGGEQLEPEEK